ncbi:uncharacterized protein DFL_003434 [Arthrobotrys flagrans]|uniref:Uncharacterized protein n=1 Tax=Arthrobotrys flagrans TaxID=97331 RepID=A0A437A1T1_ARTFL|nr:hypothetical protein DFL_003434 [Arthrobotrys flagrans]
MLDAASRKQTNFSAVDAVVAVSFRFRWNLFSFGGSGSASCSFNDRDPTFSTPLLLKNFIISISVVTAAQTSIPLIVSRSTSPKLFPRLNSPGPCNARFNMEAPSCFPPATFSKYSGSRPPRSTYASLFKSNSMVSQHANFPAHAGAGYPVLLSLASKSAHLSKRTLTPSVDPASAANDSGVRPGSALISISAPPWRLHSRHRSSPQRIAIPESPTRSDIQVDSWAIY